MIVSMDLDDALGRFDLVDANLRRLESVWTEMESLIHTGGRILGVQDERRYEELRRGFFAIAKALPAIDEYRFDGCPMDSDEIAVTQYRAGEVGEPFAHSNADSLIYGPRRSLEEYRFRFDSARRDLVRTRVNELTREVDRLLSILIERVADDDSSVDEPQWDDLKEALAEIERLAGNVTPRSGRWSDMNRHLHFGQGQDLHDIANLDWPSVRSDLELGLYSELEPLPSDVEDLVALVNTKPTGRVSTKLAWDVLDDEGFERLLFNIFSTAEGYEMRDG
jgi:hypothetical protein